MLEYHYKIFADYFQVIFADLTAIDLIGGDSYEIDLSSPLATATVYFTINTLRNMTVDVTVKLLTRPPDINQPGCDSQTVGSFTCRSGTVAVMSPTSYIGELEQFALPQGQYNIMLRIYDGQTVVSQTQGKEHYEISFWS
ncbi:MAG: hypothetical protein M3Y54_15645 [Bacteroidota bacterium]|nr:hypothetical protein [Bacteroidota bacterium]